MESVTNEDEEYEIIQKANPDLSDEEIKQRRQLWEARRTKSVKLQQVRIPLHFVDHIPLTVIP